MALDPSDGGNARKIEPDCRDDHCGTAFDAVVGDDGSLGDPIDDRGGVDQRLRLGQQGRLVGLRRQRLIGSGVEHGPSGRCPAVQGLRGDDAAA